MSWHISAPASETIHRVGQWSPHSKASLPDPAPTLSMDFMEPLNEVIMCETPHGAFQVTWLPQQCFSTPTPLPRNLALEGNLVQTRMGTLVPKLGDELTMQL